MEIPSAIANKYPIQSTIVPYAFEEPGFLFGALSSFKNSRSRINKYLRGIVNMHLMVYFS
jgi:hypothetical protein